jgi:hypothetical protein
MAIRKVKVKNDSICLYIISEIDKSLKADIRKHLQAICFGENKTRRSASIYSYKAAIKAFLKRYQRYHTRHKTGTIGELLCHVLLRKDLSKFGHASRLFNLEEQGVKKGFDIVLYHKTKKKIWITEVKSSQDKKSVQVLSQNLIKKAKQDLKSRLKNGNTQLWENAVNHAEVVLTDSKMKGKVLEVLDSVFDLSDKPTSFPLQNVILASAAFQNSEDTFDPESFFQLFEEIKTENIFNELILLSIHKKVFAEVAKFLEEEVASA